MTEIDRCRAEIVRCEEYLRSGAPDIEGALQGLQDWSAELRLIADESLEQGRGPRPPQGKV